MPRNERQRAADAALTAAIDGACEAYHGDDGEISMEYVVVVAQARIGEGGETEHTFSTLFRDGDVSTTRALGLLHAAINTLRTEQA